MAAVRGSPPSAAASASHAQAFMVRAEMPIALTQGRAKARQRALNRVSRLADHRVAAREQHAVSPDRAPAAKPETIRMSSAVQTISPSRRSLPDEKLAQADGSPCGPRSQAP